MNQHAKKQLNTFIISIVIIILAILGLCFHVHMLNNSYANAHYARTYLKYEQHLDNQKHHKVEHALFAHSLHSNDPIIKSIAINKTNMSDIINPFNKFFSVYNNWQDNHQQYIMRPLYLRDVATSNVLHDPKLFDKDLDRSGDSQIQAQSWNRKPNSLDLFVINQSSDNIKVLANARYEGWYSYDPDNKGLGEELYVANFNKKSHKITSMSKVYDIQDLNNRNNSVNQTQ